MKKIFTTAAVALMVGGALLAAIPTEADARNRGGWNSRGHGHGGFRRGWSGRGRHFVGHGRHRFRGRHFYGFGRPYGYYGYGYPAYGYGYYGGDAALAVGVGLLGVAIGSALASDRYDRDYEYERYYEYDEPHYEYDAPPRQQQLCPDGSPVTPEGYCAAPQQQPQQTPPSYYLPERG